MKPFEERYTLRLPLGENDLGSIWTAQDNDSGASVAVVMLEDEAGDAVRARFRDHAERLLGVTHANVVRALDRGDTADGTPFLVLELLEGESLAARFSQSSLRVDRAVEWLAGAAEGLGALHAAGIAHGDIEPGNIFLAGPKDKETAKIIGLALNRVDARAGTEAAARTSLASLQQGYAYAAPEQLRGETQASTAADLYSLGAVAYAVLAGRPPFVAPDPGSLLEAARTRRPPGLAAVKRELAGYATILERALAAEPSRRFADGAAFARALKTCLLMSRPTAALELPAGPRASLGENDSLDAAAPAKPTLAAKPSIAPKPGPAETSDAATSVAAPRSLAAPRALGARPLPKPTSGAASAETGAPEAPVLAVPAASADVSESATMVASVTDSEEAPPSSLPEPATNTGDEAQIDVPVDVSESATISASTAPRSSDEQLTDAASSVESAPVVAAPITLDDTSEVTTVKGASPEVPLAAPVVAAPALDDASEVTTVKGASPVGDETELSEVSEVSEVSAVLLAPPAPPPTPRVDAPELRATGRDGDAATSKRIDTGDGVESIAEPVVAPVASRPRWIVPAVLLAAALLGLGVWSATRGGAPAESVSDATPEAVAPMAASPTSVAAEPDGVETAAGEPAVEAEPSAEPEVVAEALDAGAPVVAPALVAEPVAPAPAAPTAEQPARTEPAPEAPPRAPRPAAAPAVARAAAPSAVRGGSPAAARPARPAAARPARPAAARPAQAGSNRRTGARPTVISDPGF